MNDGAIAALGSRVKSKLPGWLHTNANCPGFYDKFEDTLSLQARLLL